MVGGICQNLPNLTLNYAKHLICHMVLPTREVLTAKNPLSHQNLSKKWATVSKYLSKNQGKGLISSILGPPKT